MRDSGDEFWVTCLHLGVVFITFSSPRCLTDICVRALIKFRISQHPPPFNKIILNKHFHNITRGLNF